MSEYQWVAFRAIDAPVSPANLEYMQKQSSRAEITPWSFGNTYTYSDFRGNVLEMLRRGYDFHLHYADFGIRKLAIRLPRGLPNPAAVKPYVNNREIKLVNDPAGPGSVLQIQPFYEPDSRDSVLNCEALVDRLLPLRNELLSGDLRPLYLVHLAVACDADHDPVEETEGPVPAGLDELTDAQAALAEFFGIDDSLLKAAAKGSPPLPARGQSSQSQAVWLNRQSEATKNAWLLKLMSDDGLAARSEVLSEYRSSQPTGLWPVAELGRSVAALQAAADILDHASAQQAEEEAALERAERLQRIAKNPAKTLSEVDRLVEVRSSYEYGKAAELLVELREALDGTDQACMAEQHARKLRETFPTRRALITELRSHGLLNK